MAVVTTIRHDLGFTRADLDTFVDAQPDDGRRYELIDGAIIVTPAPVPLHQLIQSNLGGLLRDCIPEGLRILYAPLDFVMDETSVAQPDLLVVRRTDLGEKLLLGTPLLVAEVLSPSTRRIDLVLKRERYERAGVGSYWIVDPTGPTVTGWELRDGHYAEAASAAGAETFTTQKPFAVSFEPAGLLL